MNKGFVRVAVAIPQLRVADTQFNVDKIVDLAQKAEKEKVQVLCFPELCITGYTCADLFFQQQLLSDARKALTDLASRTKKLDIIIIVGLPLKIKNQLFNVAAVLQQGSIKGIVPKTHIPNTGEFYEKRWFASGSLADESAIDFEASSLPFGTNLLFSVADFTFAIEICEDLWVPVPPSTQQALHGAEIIFNLSASNDIIGKNEYRRRLIEQQSARCISGYVYASAGTGESTTDLVFGGNGFIAENGSIIATAERFSLESQLVVSEIDIERLNADRIRNSNFNNNKSDSVYRVISLTPAKSTFDVLNRKINPHPFIPPIESRNESCREIFSIQTSGLAKRWMHTKSGNLVIGVSGGLDSTLALLVCVKAADKLGYDRKRIMGVTMPGFGTTKRTYKNAIKLMESLGVTMKEISIKKACLQHFKDIDHDPNQHDITYENTQARERTQILMDLANKHNALVIGTGDLSELALGWATYNGDHMSMYAVNTGVPKTLVRYLVSWAATELNENSQTILKDVLDTPVSPELLPADEKGEIAQKTEDVVGPYELHDFFLYYYVRFGFSPEKILYLAERAFEGSYSEEIIRKWLKVFLRRFYSQQFKRSCMPDGPKVGSINLSPRGDWRMPSDAVINIE